MSFFVALRDDTFSTDPFWLCSRLSLRRSVHSRTNHSETNSLPAQITVRSTHSQPLVPFFQRRCPNFSSSVPTPGPSSPSRFRHCRLQCWVRALRTVPSCIDLLPPLGVVLSYNSWDFFPLSHDPFLLCSALPSQLRLFHLLPPLQVRLFLSSHSLSFLLA